MEHTQGIPEQELHPSIDVETSPASRVTRVTYTLPDNTAQVMTDQVMPYVLKELCHQVAHENRDMVEQAFSSAILDEKFLQEILMMLFRELLVGAIQNRDS